MTPKRRSFRSRDHLPKRQRKFDSPGPGAYNMANADKFKSPPPGGSSDTRCGNARL